VAASRDTSGTVIVAILAPKPSRAVGGPWHLLRPRDCYARHKIVIFARVSRNEEDVEDQIEVAATVRRQTIETSRGHAQR